MAGNGEQHLAAMIDPGCQAQATLLIRNIIMHGDIRDWSTFHLVARRAGRLLRRPAHADLSPGKVHLGRRWLSNEKILIALPDGGTLTVQPKYRYLQPSLQRPRSRVHSRRGPQSGPSRYHHLYHLKSVCQASSRPRAQRLPVRWAGRSNGHDIAPENLNQALATASQ